MKTEEVFKIAADVGLRSAVLLRHYKNQDALTDPEVDELHNILEFARQIAAAEREACAVDAEKQARWIGYNVHAEAIAAAIRARSAAQADKMIYTDIMSDGGFDPRDRAITDYYTDCAKSGFAL
jgi:hypothetical protein